MTLAFANNWMTKLEAAIGPSDDLLTIPLYAADALDFSAGREYILTLANDSDLGAAREIVRVAAGLVMQRGLEGTEALSWAAGTTVYCGVTAGGLQELAASSGPPAAVVEEDIPDRPPLRPGEMWITREHTFIAVGSESRYDWQRMSGSAVEWADSANVAGPTPRSVPPLVDVYGLYSSTPLEVIVAFIIDLELSPADVPVDDYRDRELIMQLHPRGFSSVRAELVIPPADSENLAVAADLASIVSYNPGTRRVTIETAEPIALRIYVRASEYEGGAYYELLIVAADFEKSPWDDMVEIPTGEPEEPGEA